ncbi:MAG: hypothetical protein ACOZNI_03155 [Myxococcota bacterium]
MGGVLAGVLAGCGGGSVGGASFTRPADSGDTAAADTEGGDESGGSTASHGTPEVDLRPPGSCSPTLPSDATVVRGESSMTEDDVRVWVCRGGILSTSGDRGAWYVDERGEALLSGTEGRAWVRASGILTVYAGPNEIWVEDGATVHVEADGVTVTTCATLPFAGGPADGCG